MQSWHLIERDKIELETNRKDGPIGGPSANHTTIFGRRR
jgi:hypothetical protein